MSVVEIESVKQELIAQVAASGTPREVLKAPEIKSLYAIIGSLDPSQKAAFGKQVNDLRVALEAAIAAREEALEAVDVQPLDVTAPWAANEKQPVLFPVEQGSMHPISQEIGVIVDIFTRMGFEAYESRQIDDDHHMFGALNFPKDHPARDGYDTFRTEEGFIPPAHTSTMQHRILKEGKEKLERGESIAAVSYGRVFRNEDVDATHEHTFYQCEGVFVSSDATLGDMLGTLRAFFESYYGQALRIKTQPAYFPFTEPGLEFAIEKPVSIGGKPGDWLEMVGCGMIHPNVLSEAGIDPKKYQGFAFGDGVERLIMLKYGIEDLRHFESARLAFLRKFTV